MAAWKLWRYLSLRDVTDAIQTVQYSDSQGTVHVYTTAAPKTAPEIFTTTNPITFDLRLVSKSKCKFVLGNDFPLTSFFLPVKMGDSCEIWQETKLAYCCTSIDTFLAFLSSKSVVISHRNIS